MVRESGGGGLWHQIGQLAGAARGHDERARVSGQKKGEDQPAPGKAGQGRRARESGKGKGGQKELVPKAGGLGPGAQAGPRQICLALRFQISNVMLLSVTSSAETKVRLRAVDVLRERKTVNLSWWNRPWALHAIRVQEMF